MHNTTRKQVCRIFGLCFSVILFAVSNSGFALAAPARGTAAGGATTEAAPTGISPLGLVLTGFSLMIGAETDQDCATYAQTAIEQYQKAITLKCSNITAVTDGVAARSYQVWSKEFILHNKWCISAGIEQAKAVELTRKNALDKCEAPTGPKVTVRVAEPTVAESPVAEPTVAESPVAESPVAESPVAESPVVESPVVEPPVVEPPVVEPPVVEPPVVEPPVVEPPVVEPPVVEPPVVEPPVVEPPVVEPPVVEPPVVEANMDAGASLSVPQTAVAVAIAIVVGFAAGGYMLRGRTSTPSASGKPVIRVRPHKDLGSSHLEADKPVATQREVHFKPVLDRGDQSVTTDDEGGK